MGPGFRSNRTGPNQNAPFCKKKIKQDSPLISDLSEGGIEMLFEEVISFLVGFVSNALILLDAWFDTFPWGNQLTPFLVFLLVVVMVVWVLMFLDTMPRNEFGD